MFLFVVVSDKQKFNSLRPLRLCGESLSAKVCVNLRLKCLKALRITLGVLCVFAARPVEYPLDRG